MPDGPRALQRVTHWIVYLAAAVAAAGTATVLFFFGTTHGALVWRRARGRRGHADQVYPLYSSLPLIRLVDHQPIISAILLFQYHRLVRIITTELARCDLRGAPVLITSCAFGRVIPRVVAASVDAGASAVVITDLIGVELQHAASKLPALPCSLSLQVEDATSLSLADDSMGANVVFFLLHELPLAQQRLVLKEAARVLAPGATLWVAEFHRPTWAPLRAMSWAYFKVFEPWALALWGPQDPLTILRDAEHLRCVRHTVCWGNFQVVSATKAAR